MKAWITSVFRTTGPPGGRCWVTFDGSDQLPQTAPPPNTLIAALLLSGHNPALCYHVGLVSRTAVPAFTQLQPQTKVVFQHQSAGADEYNRGGLA